MRLQWTDHDGRVHSGQPDDVMRLAYQAGQHHTIKPSRMFIPKDYLTKESTMFTPSTPTATMSCTSCDNITTFGFDGVLGIDYCRECGSIAGYPFGTAPQTTPPPLPRQSERLARLAEEPVDDVDHTVYGTWTKFDGTWCARVPVDDGIDIPLGSAIEIRRKNGTTATVTAGETIRRFRNKDEDGMPFIAIIEVIKEN
jgi:hypothetical protein